VREIDLRFFLDDEEPEPLAAKAPVPVDDAPPDDVPLADKLNYAAARGLDKITELLAVPLPNADAPEFGNVSRVQVTAANAAIGARLRVDENSLRARATDALPRLLEVLNREEQRLAALGEERKLPVLDLSGKEIK
jgi:hypothetical protein